jgi:hypothetical protein
MTDTFISCPNTFYQRALYPNASSTPAAPPPQTATVGMMLRASN